MRIFIRRGIQPGRAERVLGAKMRKREEKRGEERRREREEKRKRKRKEGARDLPEPCMGESGKKARKRQTT